MVSFIFSLFSFSISSSSFFFFVSFFIKGYYLGVPILKAIGKYEEEVRERGFDAVEKSLKACLWVHGLNDKKNENKR